MNLTFEETKLAEIDMELLETKEELSKCTYNPKYDGIIILKLIKCGKKNCICQRGRLHGPYPHFQYRKNGKLHQKYLNKKIIPEYKDGVENDKKIKSLKRKIRNLENERKELIKKGDD